MKKAEIKARMSLVDDRFMVLVKKYPVLSIVIVLSSVLIGFVLGLLV